MMGLFARASSKAGPDTATLGAGALALPLPAGALVPANCIGVVFDKGGRTRRIGAAGRIDSGEHERAIGFHPGPYSADVLPFQGAPELGLHLTFVVDSPDPRVAQQRFDLYLASEAPDGVQLSTFCALIEAALQRELAQGNLELPPCTSLGEWDTFRAGLNQLMYTRFGLAVEDCVPVDLGEAVDYAQLLLARAVPAPEQAIAARTDGPAPTSDGQAIRRLFLELPCVTGALRLVALPPGQSLFRKHQELLQRLSQVSLSIATMPALELAAPGVTLAAAHQAERARHGADAVAALDEAWALLARLARTPAAQLDAVFDEADRIVANLELHSAARRATP